MPLELIDGFEVGVIVAQFLAAKLTKLAGRELGTRPDRHTTGQLTPTTGEAGRGHRARLETSNVPFMSHKKKLSITPAHGEPGHPLSPPPPPPFSCKAHLSV